MNNILVLIFLIIPQYSRASETLSNLITDARVLASDASSVTRQRFSDTQITEFLNQAQRQALFESRCLMSSLSFTLTAGVTYYSLPSNYMSMERATIGSLWMTELTPAALDGRSRGWEASSGHPTYYFINFSSRGLIGFAPWPATSTDTDTIKIEYQIQANDLANSTDIPFNGITELQEFHHGLAYYAAGMMEMINGMTSQASAYFSNFQTIVKNMNMACRLRPNYMPSAVASP